MSGTYFIAHSIAPAGLAVDTYMQYASTTAPSSPVEGQTVWTDTSTVATGIPKVYLQGTWQVCATVVPPLTQNTDTSLTFVGYRFPVYGEALWENFLHLLENFAAPQAPRNPVVGQIWVDTTTSPGVPKVYNNKSQWSIIAAGLTIATSPPTISTDPLYPTDMWFNPNTNSLQYYDATTGWTGVNCTAYASQIEYNALIDTTRAVAATLTTYPQYTAPTAQKIPTTTGTSNAHPSTAQWSALLTDVKAIATVVQYYNAHYTPPLDNAYWDTAVTSLQNALASGENFLWCPAGPNGTGNMHGLSTYSSLLDTITSVLTTVNTWQSVSAPVAAFTQSATVATPASPVISFYNQSTNADSYLWTFNDGTASTEATPQHTFNVPGVYPIRLTATNVKGQSVATGTVTTYVIPITAFKNVGAIAGAPPLNVSFLDTSLNSPTSWLWTLSNVVTNTIITTSSAQNFQYNFTAIGTYEVTLVASNQAGSGAPVTSRVDVVRAPIAAFTRTPTSAVNAPPLTVSFTDTSINSPTSWLWTFGDGATSTLQNPSHTYSTVGIFTVTLKANNLGGSNTYTFPACVATVVPPVAAFVATNTTGTAPLAVTFSDTSTNYPTSWLWNFGDGATSTVQNPVHTYTANGSFTVSLTVTNLAGTNTVTKSSFVSTEFNFNITLSASENNVNLTSKLTAIGWNGASPLVGTITVAGGVTIGSSSTSLPALRTGGSFPVGSTVSLVNNGYIVGRGGNGNGGSGGPALQFDGNTAIKLRLTNNGVIGGGGGAGGAGGGGRYYSSTINEYVGTIVYDDYSVGGGGGGGAGSTNGSGGSTNGSGSGPYAYYRGPANGAAGSTTAGGAGGAGSYGHAGYVSPQTYTTGGNGGSGGALGASGGSGGYAVWSSESYGSGQVNGPAGSIWQLVQSVPNPTSGGAGGNAIVNSAGISLPTGSWGTYYGALA